MKKRPRAQDIGDFTADWRMVPIAALAILIGLLSTGVAWLLLRLIGLFTNLCYYHRWDTSMVSPAANQLGAWAILIPVAGLLVIGLMARYGSERIRGHGGQYLYPVVNTSQQLKGVITRKHLQKLMADPDARDQALGEIASQVIVVAYPDEPSRVVVNRMAQTGLTRFPIVDRGDEQKLLGIIGLRDLLSARTRNLEEERTRERVLRLRLPILGKIPETAPPGGL